MLEFIDKIFGTHFNPITLIYKDEEYPNLRLGEIIYCGWEILVAKSQCLEVTHDRRKHFHKECNYKYTMEFTNIFFLKKAFKAITRKKVYSYGGYNFSLDSIRNYSHHCILVVIFTRYESKIDNDVRDKYFPPYDIHMPSMKDIHNSDFLIDYQKPISIMPKPKGWLEWK